MNKKSLKEDKQELIVRKENKIIPIQDDSFNINFMNNILFYDELMKFKENFIDFIKSVGRIGIQGYNEVATGFLVKEGVIVTNSHVVHALGKNLKFYPKSEYQRGNSDIMLPINEEPIYIEAGEVPDIAFLRIENYQSTTLDLAGDDYQYKENTIIVTIGHPLYDGLTLSNQVMNPDSSGCKQIQPGSITNSEEKKFYHNCSVLKGNSGSPIFDMASGKVIGIHYHGDDGINFAFKSSEIRRLMQEHKIF